MRNGTVGFFCRNGAVAERLRSSYDSQACEAKFETKPNKVVALEGKGGLT